LIELAKLVRVNTNITEEINDWLNERSEKTGVSKSTLIHLALEQYRNQVDVMKELPKMTQMLEMLSRLTNTK
jgi:predicted DNA-binding protein